MIYHRLIAPAGLAPTTIALYGGTQLRVPPDGIVEIPHALEMPGDTGVFEPVGRTVETGWLRQLLDLGFRQLPRTVHGSAAAAGGPVSGRDVLRRNPRPPAVVVRRGLAGRGRRHGLKSKQAGAAEPTISLSAPWGGEGVRFRQSAHVGSDQRTSA